MGAGWGHAYYCPDHIVLLDFDPARPHEHRCPGGSRALLATSPSNPPAERQSTLLRRSHGPWVSYAAVVEPFAADRR
ncbi:hypothetical protein ACWDWO_25075 [Actinopolymorpha singaporensis]